ncbi:MAG: exonuclease subunit SbcD [Bacteroidales bacterium]|nr:exonuclease subunit SbcD [Bacteroidales bacterium]
MKILHTSDWHIGKRLGSVYRIEEQRTVLDEICIIADNQAVDAVVIAGDLFDTYNPSVDAVELLYASLKRLTNNGSRPVIAIAGNHDSPDRIEAPNSLARDNGIFLFGYPKTEYSAFSNELPFSVRKTAPGFIEFVLQNNEKLRLIVAPFANEHRMKEAFISEESMGLVDSLQNFWRSIAQEYCDKTGVNILVGHHLMLPVSNQEIEEPDNEKPIQAISELLPTSIVPPQIQYVALGHLHAHKIVSHSPLSVYSGSICSYSFSEAHQKKYVSIVHCVAGKEAEIEKVELSQRRELHRVTCASIEEARAWLEKHQNCYVELSIHTDMFISPVDIKSLHDVHDGIIYVIPLVNQEDGMEAEAAQDFSHTRSIDELFTEYFIFKTGVEPNQEIMSIFKEIRSEKM